MKDRDFEGGRAFGSAPPVTEEESNVQVKGEFGRPQIHPHYETVRLDMTRDLAKQLNQLNNPTDLRASIINKAATEAREAYDHWIEAVSFLRIVEPGAEKEYGSLTKGLFDATVYMESKE